MMMNDSRAGEARIGNPIHVQNQQELKSADGGVRSASQTMDHVILEPTSSAGLG